MVEEEFVPNDKINGYILGARCPEYGAPCISEMWEGACSNSRFVLQNPGQELPEGMGIRCALRRKPGKPIDTRNMSL